MRFSSRYAGLVAAGISAVSFGTSGVFVKPLVSLRGRWDALWRARWRVLGMGVIGVAITQVLYFAAIRRIPVSTALLVEYLAPLILVGFTWAVTRRAPRPTVLVGSVLAVGGLVLVIGPGAIQVVDPLGLLLAFGAAVGCALYFVIAARPADGLAPVALAGSGLLLASVLLALVGASGVLPFTAAFGELPVFGSSAPWWVPLLVVAVVGTALAYATGITASGLLGSRLASFVGLLEVVFASLFAWFLLGEELSPLQLAGGVLILGGIAAGRAEEPAAAAVAEADVVALEK